MICPDALRRTPYAGEGVTPLTTRHRSRPGLGQFVATLLDLGCDERNLARGTVGGDAAAECASQVAQMCVVQTCL